MDVAASAYLARIGVEAADVGPTLDALARLQVAHMISVPFENLDVFHGLPVRTDAEWSSSKVVRDRRGGWCFELNGAFASLLHSIGFALDLVACRVWGTQASAWGPELDHLAIVVHLDDGDHLVDVGFGDSCLRPLPIVSGVHRALPRDVRLTVGDRDLVLEEATTTGHGDPTWERQLWVDLTPRRLTDFDQRSAALRSEPSSLFRQKPFATRALDDRGARVTLREHVFRRREGTSAWVDTDVTDDDQWSNLLLEHFDITGTRRRSASDPALR